MSPFRWTVAATAVRVNRDRAGTWFGEGSVKRLVAVLVAAVLGLSLAGFDGASASPGTPAVAAAIDWASCPDGSSDECALFPVPLDYGDPGGATIKLAVRMRPATELPYLGVMLVNPGGPGGSGTGMVGLADNVPGGVGRQYDVIGWDPRGVGASRPALRCDSSHFGTNRPSYVPSTRKLMRFWKAKTARYAARCGASAASYLLPHMSTLDNVKDMESLRDAFAGEKNPGGINERLNFYGFSYGTYLGQVYASQYPTRVGRFVFDGVVDPATYWYRANLKQEKGFDRNLNVFFKWMAQHPRAYRLGRDWRDIRRGYDALLKKLDRRPAYHRKLGPSELTDAILWAGYYNFYWDGIGSAYSRLVRFGKGGQMFHWYRSTTMGDDNGYAVYLGVQCSDQRRPAWSTQRRDAWRIHRKDPFLAWDNTWFNAPCLRWPAPSGARPAVGGGIGSGKILLVNETLDAATPFSGALRVRSAFPAASALIAGVGGTTHSGSLSGVTCVDSRISAFLKTGVLPARKSGTRADVECPKVPPPAASWARQSGSLRSAEPGSRSSLQDLLMSAQRGSLR